MYNGLGEVLLLQIHDRAGELNDRHARLEERPHRHWWRKVVRVAR